MLLMSSYSCDLCCVYECNCVNALGYKDAYTHATPFCLLRDVHRHAPSKRLPLTVRAAQPSYSHPYSHPYNTQSPDGHPLGRSA